MIVDKFLAGLGVFDMELTPDVRVLLLEKVKEFFRCGGTLRWTDFLEMEEGTAGVFKEALAAVEGEKMVRAVEAFALMTKEPA